MTKDEWRNIFGDNLNDIIQDAGTTQKHLAKDSGLAVGTISDYVNKWAVPSVPAIINLAYSLDVSIDELIDFGDRIDE